MRTPVRGYAARRRWLGLKPSWVVAGAVVLVAVAAFWASGINPMRLFGPNEPSTRGLIPIPVSAMAIPSYTKLTRDHLWNAQAGTMAVLYLHPTQVTPDVIRNFSAIIGRVLDHDKPSGYAFTEADFMPKGTRPGLVAGIPPGKRAMRIGLEKIPGLAGLMPGDRFDIVSTLPISVVGGGGIASSGIYAQQLDLQSRLSNWQKQATVRVVVQNGNIVQPVTTRQVPVASNTMTSGMIVRQRPVQEVVIAVAPGEVAHLTEALAVGAELACVPRSGRPEDPRDSITPASSPWSPFGGVAQGAAAPSEPSAVTTSTPSLPSSMAPAGVGAGFTPIETISGTRREIVAAPVRRR